MMARLAIPPVLGVLGLTLWQAVLLIQQDLAFTTLETEVSFWGRGDYRPKEITRERTGKGIEQLLQKTPRHPEYLSLHASQLAWEGYWAEEDTQHRTYSEQALATQYTAQEYRPAHGQGWGKLIQYAATTPAGAGYATEAEQRLRALKRW